MAVQPTDYEPMMPAPSPLTTGGNVNLRNGDEDDAASATYERTGVVQAALGEDDAHVQGVYRKGGL